MNTGASFVLRNAERACSLFIYRKKDADTIAKKYFSVIMKAMSIYF
jgi:hypothetical protein